MALLIALGVGAPGILVAFGCGICRFYRSSGRRDSVVKRSGEKRRLIDDSSEEDNYGSKGELSKGESSKEESGSEEYVKEKNKAKGNLK